MSFYSQALKNLKEKRTLCSPSIFYQYKALVVTIKLALITWGHAAFNDIGLAGLSGVFVS